MGYLKALFKVNLPGNLLMRMPMASMPLYLAEPRPLEFTLEGFDVQLRFKQVMPVVNEGEGTNWNGVGSKVHLTLGRHEQSEPPPIIQSADGVRDTTVQAHYFDALLPEFRQVAVVCLNRLILYFKFELRNPSLRTINESFQDLQNPEWFLSDGKTVAMGSRTLMVPGVPGLFNPKFSARPFGESDHEHLLHQLMQAPAYELVAEILSDAQAAAVEGNFRRAILEMAIACEVAAKSAFFGTASVPALAFQWLEEKNQYRVKLLQLIHEVADHIWGSSFKVTHKADYESVELLFRCRNNIAHRGEATYRDRDGVHRSLNPRTFTDWWSSVEVLLAWLNAKRHSAE